MLRRSHKKSRGGCLECKRRHVKCDEGRPVCFLCTMSGRNCSYASQSLQRTPPKSNGPFQKSSISPGDNHAGPTPDVNPLASSIANSSPNPDSPAASSTDSHLDPILDEPVNLNHMELLIHLSLADDLFNLGFNPDPVSSTNLALKVSQESPCLLHLLLAISARHLAYLHPERSTSYLHQAVTLQTRAISMFNSSWTSVDESNCVMVLFFSSVLGHHMLADTLARRDNGGLDSFMNYYIQFAGMHRGIYAIASSAWPVLMESELAPILSWSHGYHTRPARGNHCHQVMTLINGSVDLREEEKEACRSAINYLQIGFDAIFSEQEEGNRYHIIFIWMLLVSPEFTALLAAKRPEALVSLAYYALLLHYGRSMWQVRDAGVYIMTMVTDYLGSEWAHWLEYPRGMMAKEL